MSCDTNCSSSVEKWSTHFHRRLNSDQRCRQSEELRTRYPQHVPVVFVPACHLVHETSADEQAPSSDSSAGAHRSNASPPFVWQDVRRYVVSSVAVPVQQAASQAAAWAQERLQLPPSREEMIVVLMKERDMPTQAQTLLKTKVAALRSSDASITLYSVKTKQQLSLWRAFGDLYTSEQDVDGFLYISYAFQPAHR